MGRHRAFLFSLKNTTATKRWYIRAGLFSLKNTLDNHHPDDLETVVRIDHDVGELAII